MEKMYRDFTICENCGERCYLGNRFCEDCANKLYVVEKERFQAHKETDCKTIQDQSDLIEKLKSENHALISDNAYQEADIFELTQKLAIQDQDKISFAVEQLTEIRDYVKNCWSLDTTEGKVRLDIAKKIRLKIEELTHQHEDKGE